MLSRFHLIPERHGRTDRQTDGRTDRRTDRIAISISRDSALTRDKNDRLALLLYWLKFYKVISLLFFCFKTNDSLFVYLFVILSVTIVCFYFSNYTYITILIKRHYFKLYFHLLFTLFVCYWPSASLASSSFASTTATSSTTTGD